MKRDLKINYGILDQIIEQLHTYKRALHQMQTSLHTIAGFTERNAGKSLEAWEELMQQSKKNIQSYQTQIEDLLTLFENYVADTTAYISPISRNSMMRVDRNDIWGNLTQIEWGVTYRLSRAIQETYRSPSLLFSLFDDTDPEEKERSRYNKQQLESIRNDMESVQSKLKNKMEELWDLYESKVKKYENTDDEYANKASQVKDRYTTFSEKVSDVISVTAEGAWDFVKGLAVAIYEIAKGLITLVIDAGIVAASGIIPDSIEPDFLKKASTKRIESATETLDAIIHDPVIVLESMAQSITDTAEKEGIMYVSGSAATSFLPYVGQAKYLKLLKGEKSKNKANEIRSAISQKSTESLQRIDGSKKENSLWPNGIKNSGKQYVQEVTHFFRQTFMPHPSFQLSTANQVPVNVWSRATIENRMDSIVPVSLRKVEGKGTAKGIDNASVTNKSNLYRGDSLLHSPTRPNGIGKPHISSSGDLVPASKDGLYKGRQVTVTEHILGGYRKGAKSNSPYTSFTNNKNVIGNYGENAIELDISALRKDIQSGKVKDVVILSPKQIQKLIERDVISSDFWKNRAINWTKRDNEYLIKGEVPSQYIKVSPKE
ncbi:YwqI/YxiC family protein [Niallia circulans]|nr:YwqI/YxiC family protein [Niallia circulans]